MGGRRAWGVPGPGEGGQGAGWGVVGGESPASGVVVGVGRRRRESHRRRRRLGVRKFI
ncbi:hypothetical protein TIFTF001_038934 [Ficus carica]|uniref:Uncharacterized protein n=1 Tax=Ficus carica TaxID=3494 RepID=A0AA88EJ84_FICCA|nr:hypothetical protein TIFTF001_038934 [Ficus carica]